MPEILLEVLDAVDDGEYYTGWAIVGGEGVRDYTDVYGVRMYCPADELFAPDTQASASLLPITPRHPARDVDPENWNELSIGVTGEKPERRGNQMAIFFKVTAAWAIEQIREMKAAGLPIRFSLGYKTLPDKTPGNWMGKLYDWVMRRIRFNHLALLLDNSTPRHDGTGEIYDSFPSQHSDDGELLLCMDSFSSTTNKPQEAQTVKKKLPKSGVEIEISDSDARYFDNHLTDFSTLETDLADAKGQIKQLERDLKSAQATVTDSVINSAVQDRLELALEAASILDSEDVKELAGMSPRELREAVLIADGYTEDELKDLRAECKDSYDATLGGMYRTVIRKAGAQESERIIDSSHRSSVAAGDKGGRQLIKSDKVADARKRRAERANGGKK